MQWEHQYAQRIQNMKSSAIRDLLKITERPDFISFAGGLPAPEAFPVAEIAACTQTILQTQGAQALQYGPTEGYYPLRELIAQQLSRDGLHLRPTNVLITAGSQQALDLLGKVFLDPGDHVAVESPTYLGALQAWNAYGAHYLTIPTDDDGLIVDALEPLLQERQPKFLYVMPNFQNPGGITLSHVRREKLLSIAQQYSLPLIEDDAYAQLRFAGTPSPSLLHLTDTSSLAQSSSYQGNVLYLGTFSKTLAPGLRLGWMIGPEQVIAKLVQAKQGVDLHTPTLNQMLAYEIVRSGFLEGHVERLRSIYRVRRDAMLAALQQHFPAETRWTQPEGGMFLWVTLPIELDAEILLQAAIEQKVAFVPGTAFHAQGGGHNTLRLNFSNATPERITTGIARMGRVIRHLRTASQLKALPR